MRDPKDLPRIISIMFTPLFRYIVRSLGMSQPLNTTLLPYFTHYCEGVICNGFANCIDGLNTNSCECQDGITGVGCDIYRV